MKRIIVLTGLGLLICLAGPARADMLGFSFSGQWESVGSSLIGWFPIGGTFEGIIRYDTSSSDVWLADTSRGKYTNNHFTFNTNDSGGNKWGASDNAAELRILDNVPISGVDKDQFVVWFYPPYDGNLQFPAALPTFLSGYINLTDDQATVFDSDDLPNDITKLTDYPFEDMNFCLSFINGSVSGSITELTPLPTPEPATTLLLATGLAGMTAFKRRSKKSSN